MDDALIQFREAAHRENRSRVRRRRYSRELQQQAVAYWGARRGADSVRTIATALGVSETTLQRWTLAMTRRPRFRPIDVRELSPAAIRHHAGGPHDHDGRPACRGVDRGDGGTAADAVAMRWHGRRVSVYAYAEPTDMRKGSTA